VQVAIPVAAVLGVGVGVVGALGELEAADGLTEGAGLLDPGIGGSRFVDDIEAGVGPGVRCADASEALEPEHAYATSRTTSRSPPSTIARRRQ
jgi:hypothetical protein